MNPTIMDGFAVANRLHVETSYRAAQFEYVRGRRPCLATVLVGDDPASHTYVRMKTNRCRTTGLASQSHRLPEDASTKDAVNVVGKLSDDETVDGILVQHPMPPQVDEREVFEAITPAKDVDGVTGASIAVMTLGTMGFQSCTPGGILRLLDTYDINPAGQHVVVMSGSRGIGAIQDRSARCSLRKISSDQGQLNSQMVPENGVESDSSHVFPDYCQQVPDRTAVQ
ncbi:bifunctional 5,10-methylenetetrahydrofolate dehydrogenase/5,10-methenyltetrahydrofolate cyclohydrolase [Mycolicibacterium farcinogenes]|uniref:Bifunctional 5,10-methylenetetrahydrofolate dehydrogenase/5,10-methenyltetrahydrofolate cyclohydrolase n=1 Tax=Mycolicibacterium farcinogenes TaxID=1802 RepID=A0ACD1FQR9_MYCFR|nr:bifunctional 5,10-methylenetetrahydrofolate dehydrogenase/5,10-methenyltetrahydrofolate cyclohydrolase [Mycolicibacterium farcinogenes]QZH69410.1 bifunctional 5,10-methylenetetrahydrofolate dehydrogenase/5,10-methenyltetrahydrofolate cyclohydrolase [Mycolicibacterium farcinogenes]